MLARWLRHRGPSLAYANMVTWLQALLGGKLPSKTSDAEMVEPATLADGTPLRYGMGGDVRQDALADSGPA